MQGRGRIDTRQPINWRSPLNRGLVRWWLGLPGQAGGPLLADLATGGRANAGTLTNGPTWAAGGPDGLPELALDGSDDYVDCGQATGLTGLAAFSIEAACRPTSVSGGSANLRYVAAAENTGGGAAATAFILRLSTSPVRWEWYVASGSTFYGPAIWTGVSAGADYHLVGTYTGASLALYVNGVLAGTASGPGAGTPANAPAQPVCLGSTATATGRAFAGRIRSVRGYSRAVSAAEAWGLYDQARLGYPDLLRRATPRAWLVAPTSPPPPPPAGSGFPAAVVGGGYGW